MPQTTKVTFSDDVKDNKKVKSYNRSIKLANYDGTGEWRDYKSHVDACAAHPPKCYFSSLWHTTGLHNWGHDIIIISHFGK
jgi:hypothetical protein